MPSMTGTLWVIIVSLAGCSKGEQCSDGESDCPQEEGSGSGADTSTPGGQDSERAADSARDEDSGSSSGQDSDPGSDTQREQDSGVEGEADWTEGSHSCEADRYLPLSVQGWAVCADEALFSSPEHGEAVLSLLASDLQTILDRVPATAVERLQGVRIWIERSSDWSGAVYHPSASWLTDNGYPSYWAESIQIANSDDYLSWTAVQPAIVLHELSHAWHHQVLGYGDAQIAEAYAQAVASGQYEDVAYAGGGSARAYALTDELEYFAELSEAWFWENDFYPFVRQDVLDFDPLGAKVLEDSWAR